MAYLTRQEIFDKVWNHFVVNKGKPSFKPSANSTVPQCLYRGPNGAKCAIGILIPDEVYSKQIENHAVFDFFLDKLKAKKFVAWFNETMNPDDLKFVQGLQYVHDNSCSCHNFYECIERELRFVINIYNLERKP